MLTPHQRAIAEWREAHPQDSDIPDENIGGLIVVQRRTLGIALQDLGRVLVAEFGRIWNRLRGVEDVTQ